MKYEENGMLKLVSVCAKCGEIEIESNSNEEKREDKTDFSRARTRAIDYVRISLIFFILIFSVTSVFFYFKVVEKNTIIDALTLYVEAIQTSYLGLNESYVNLASNYLSILNTTTTLEGYYSDLQEMYSSIRSEYSILEDSYSVLTQNHAELQSDYYSLLEERDSLERELDERLNFSRDEVLEEAIVDILPEGNITRVYDIQYAGYLVINFSSSADIIFWVGSSVTEGIYYARYPDYPNTASKGSFTIPVLETVYLYIGNPNDELGTTVSFSVHYRF